jgi:predicted TIM-barrel fold metal-dependent hydrolase
MYLHPDLPSYKDQIDARDRMLENNPDLTFIGAHLGSMEWNGDEIAMRLDKFPNMSVDMAARIGQIFHQTQLDRKKVRKFFIEYQDRILYSTDGGDSGSGDANKLADRIHTTWLIDWEFLTTDNAMTSELISGEFNGLKLLKKVIDKIYSGNARKWLGMFKP